MGHNKWQVNLKFCQELTDLTVDALQMLQVNYDGEVMASWYEESGELKMWSAAGWNKDMLVIEIF